MQCCGVRALLKNSARLWVLITVASLTAGSACTQQAAAGKTSATESGDRGLLLGLYFPNGATWDDLRNGEADQKWALEIPTDPNGKH